MKILGTTERRTCEIAVKDLQLSCTVDEFHKEYKHLCREYLSDCKMLKGTELNFAFHNFLFSLNCK